MTLGLKMVKSLYGQTADLCTAQVCIGKKYIFAKVDYKNILK